MRSKRLELQESLKNQKPSTLTKRQQALRKQKSATKKPRVALVDGQRENEIVTDAVDAGLNAVAQDKPRLSVTEPCSAFVSASSANETVTDAVNERLNVVALEMQRSATKQCPAFVSGRRAKETVTDADAVAFEKQKSSTRKARAVLVDGQREDEIVTDAVDERLNVVAPEKQWSATKPCPSFVNGRREQKVVANAAVGERLNAVALEKQKSLTIKPRAAYVNRHRKTVTMTGAVGERPDAVALEKQNSSATKPRSEIANGSWTDEIASIAVDARLNAVALKKQRSATTAPCPAFHNGSRAKKIVSDLVDLRLNVVDDARSDIGSDSFDSWSNVRDEDADILDSIRNGNVQMVEDQLLPTNSGEDADIIDSDEDSDLQIAEDQSLSTDPGEDADILDADGNGDMQIVEDQSLLTNSENVAGSSGKRKRDEVRNQVADPHSESNNTNCTDNGQGSTSRPSDTRIMIMFDKYGRPCDVGSEQFATDIGRVARANCPPAIKDWRIVPDSTKENIWKILVARYVIPEVYKPNILSRARSSWKTWKSNLRAKMDQHETIADKKKNMPYLLIRKREDWESFVDFCDTEEQKKLRAIGKKSREAMEFVQSCGRKGIYRTIYELEKESPTGEVNRSAVFLDTHVSKTMNDPESTSVSDIKLRLIKELVEANPDGQNDIENDAVALVCGPDSRGHVRGMGGGVSRTTLRASATVVETLRKVQQENRSLQSDIKLLIAESGKPTQKHTSTPLHQSLANIQNRISTPSYQSASQAPAASNLPVCSSSVPPDVFNLPARSHLTSPAPNSPARSLLVPPASNSPARSRLAPPASSLPASSRLAPPASSLPASSRLPPPASSLPASSRMAPPASSLPSSSCFIKNFKGRTIALGSFNTAEPPMEHVYSLIIEDIFDRDAELFDKDGKLGDIMIGGVINWPKACVESNLPANSCFVRNFKRRTIAFGSFSTPTDPQMEHVYCVIVKEIYDREAELFDTDGKLGDIMIGGVINWPKACIKPCRQ